MTEYHVMSCRINGTTYDLDGVDKARFTEEEAARAFAALVRVMRGADD